ncbi:MAG: hypothetical protein DMG65_09265 [Candidatus Angelobacter sp. Gp1-AA117]|nr:MAG: hypothetical protein DMG65_09265 [Candidatus Angelobacter sp. Gp1-AA117]
MAGTLKCGDTFLAPKTSSAIEHLWIIVTHPDKDGRAVCVNVTTQHSYSETTVILKKGDHPFIQHDSVINYADSQLLNIKSIQAAIAAQPRSYVCKIHEPCSPKMLEDVQNGLLKSKLVKKDIKERCIAEWANKPK